MSSRNPEVRRQAGILLVDVVISLTVLLTGLGMFVSSLVALKTSRQSATEVHQAHLALKTVVETLQTMGPTDALQQYRPALNGDPFPAPGSGPGPRFDIPELVNQDNPDAQASVEILFFTNENEVRPELNLPRDLDGDGLLGNADVGRLGPDGQVLARVLPVQVQIRWRGARGNNRVEIWHAVLTRD